MINEWFHSHLKVWPSEAHLSLRSLLLFSAAVFSTSPATGGPTTWRGGRRRMRAVVQRVISASVEVEERVVSAIGPGLLVLVGFHESDADAEFICRKVLNMRLFPNEKTGKAWDQSVLQRNFEVLLVSQFTLYGILKGNKHKPDFHVAMPPAKAKPFYAALVEKFQRSYSAGKVKDGVFGAMMKVSLVNDGPVTMQVDTLSARRRSVKEW